MRCEDYPCCGHTDGLPCDWTYTRAFDRIHAFCEHEAGFCEVDHVTRERWEQGLLTSTEERNLFDRGEISECEYEFGPHTSHEDCQATLEYMEDPFGDYYDWENESHNRELEEDRLGRPLFPNEY